MTDTFNFPYHQVAEDNPAIGSGVQFGQSYQFNSGPTAPPQRMFTLTMRGMKVFTNSDGSIDASTSATRNMKAFYNFWQAHYLHVSFNYTHPLHGAMLCRFGQPLKLPTPIEGGSGVYPDFQIQLLEQP